MAYLGNQPTSSTFAIDSFNGDNSTVNFTLREAPVTTSSILVFVGGIRQHTDTYSLSSTTLTFSEAPPTGTNNIQVLFLGLGASPHIPSDFSVSATKLQTGAVTSDKISSNAVTSTTIQTGAITSDKIAANAVTTAAVADGAINTSELASQAVTGDKIGLTAINANNIVDGTITNAKLASPGATTGKAIAMAIVFGG